MQLCGSDLYETHSIVNPTGFGEDIYKTHTVPSPAEGLGEDLHKAHSIVTA